MHFWQFIKRRDVILVPLLNGRRNVQFEADFCALHCDDLFLVGYGLDYNGKYRNLPYIGYVEV